MEPNKEKALSGFNYSIAVIMASIPGLNIFGIGFAIVYVIYSTGDYSSWKRMKPCVYVLYILALVMDGIWMITWIAVLEPEFDSLGKQAATAFKAFLLIIWGNVLLLLITLLMNLKKVYDGLYDEPNAPSQISPDFMPAPQKEPAILSEPQYKPPVKVELIPQQEVKQA